MPYENNRHPTKQESANPTDRPPSISCGKVEMDLLIYLKNNYHTVDNIDNRFSVRSYCKQLYDSPNRKRTTIIDNLNRLKVKGLVSHELGVYSINGKGLSYLKGVGEGVGLVRKGGRRPAQKYNVSQHHTEYKIGIKEKYVFNDSWVRLLNAKDHKVNRLRNLTIHYLYYDDMTIQFNPKVIIIKIHDIVGNDIDDVVSESFDKCLKKYDIIKRFGLRLGSIYCDDVHFANIKDVFASVVDETVKGLRLDLGDGDVYYIDRSPKGDKSYVEGETNSKEVSDNVRQLLVDMKNSDSRFSDLDDIKEILKETSRMLLYLTEESSNINKASKNLVNIELLKNKGNGFGGTGIEVPDYMR